MTALAPVLAPPLTEYRGAITRPERWSTWVPRKGDILVCTPSKAGTTWTQTMLAMLVHGGTDLPQKVPILSPWVDADLGVPAEEVAAALAAQPGRRVVKTHTPADGFPVWDGVTVIAVYRHPLDIFFSLLKHMANRATIGSDNPLLAPVHEALRGYLTGVEDIQDFERDTLANLALHYRRTALAGRLPASNLFHYADMTRDGRATVAALARAAGIKADARLIGRVAEATAFGTMKANAMDYVPVAGTGFWKAEANFFDSGTSRKWDGVLGSEDLALYAERLKQLVPDEAARRWLEEGAGTLPA